MALPSEQTKQQEALPSVKALAARAPMAAAVLSVIANLMFLPQALCLAATLGELISGRIEEPFWLQLSAFVILSLLRATLEATVVRLGARAAHRVKQELRALVARRIASWSPLDISRPAPGEIAGLISSELEGLDPFITRYTPVMMRMRVMPLLYLALVACFSWALSGLLLLAGLLLPLSMALVGIRAKKAADRQVVEIGAMTGQLLDRLRGLTTVRLFLAEDRAANRLEEQSNSLAARTMAVLKIAFLSSAALELISMFGLALTAAYVGSNVAGLVTFGSYGHPLDIAHAIFLLLIAQDFFQPLRDFSAAYHDKATADAVSGRLQALMEGSHAMMPGAEAALMPASRLPVPVPASPISTGMDVVMRNLTLAHQGATEPVFSGLSLRISAGEKVALRAPSGFGKSTLLAAIAGFIAPMAGAIELDGAAMSEETATLLRRQIAWVGQTPHLIHGSLRQNVALAAPGATPQEITAALKAAAADDFVARAPEGLMTRIGEGGTGISGGEARRLGLARAILSPARLVLADEPTEHLDQETASAVLAGLIKAAEGRTLLVTTHDPAVMAAMDRVISLDELSPIREAAE